MYAINRIKLLISEYEHKINTSNNDKIYRKDLYRYFINDLKDVNNDIFCNYLENSKGVKWYQY